MEGVSDFLASFHVDEQVLVALVLGDAKAPVGCGRGEPGGEVGLGGVVELVDDDTFVFLDDDSDLGGETMDGFEEA